MDTFCDWDIDVRCTDPRGGPRATAGVLSMPLVVKSNRHEFTVEVTAASDPHATATACASRFGLSSRHAARLEAAIIELQRAYAR